MGLTHWGLGEMLAILKEKLWLYFITLFLDSFSFESDAECLADGYVIISSGNDLVQITH